VSFAVNSAAPKGSRISHPVNGWAIVGIILASIFGIGIIVLIVLKCIQKKFKKARDELRESINEA
jgi:hypothetical protein